MIKLSSESVDYLNNVTPVLETIAGAGMEKEARFRALRNMFGLFGRRGTDVARNVGRQAGLTYDKRMITLAAKLRDRIANAKALRQNTTHLEGRLANIQRAMPNWRSGLLSKNPTATAYGVGAAGTMGSGMLSGYVGNRMGYSSGNEQGAKDMYNHMQSRMAQYDADNSGFFNRLGSVFSGHNNVTDYINNNSQ